MIGRQFSPVRVSYRVSCGGSTDSPGRGVLTRGEWIDAKLQGGSEAASRAAIH